MNYKHIPNHRQYTITEQGVVTRVVGARKPNTPIRQSFHKVKGSEYPNGYYYVTLCTEDYILPDGNIVDCPCLKPIAIHRLIALTFIPKPSDKHIWVNHKDGNKINNSISNLEWTTISENIQHAYDTGLKVAKKGKESHMYGHICSLETKAKMSAKKQGENHPKFKGYYFVKWVKYVSSYEASRKTGILPKTIYMRCHNPKFKSEGYYFMPVNPNKTVNDNQLVTSE